MASPSPVAFALLRVPRGQGRPSEQQFREALAKDRERLHQTPAPERSDLIVAGPYAIVVDDAELDEYVVWER